MLGRITAAVATVLVATAAPAIADDPVDVPDGATITIDGRGHGHGRGMSQVGADHAAEAGQDYEAILETYYPGTALGRAGGSVRVWISRSTSDAVQVASRPGLTARKVGTGTTWKLTKAKPRATQWRIVASGAASVLEYRQRGWHRFRKVGGQLELTASGKPVQLLLGGGATATYRGALRSVPFQGRRLTVNVVPLEAYLRGVVPSEITASTWHPQAQRAQAVASRSYAVAERAEGGTYYDLDDSTRYQSYLGVDREHPASDAAVRATQGRVLTFGEAPASTEFTASNGGWTVTGDAPYLLAQEDPWDDDTWGSVTFTDAELERHWPSIGDLESIEITSRDGHGQWGGRVLSVTLTGAAGTKTVTGSGFYGELGLQSAWLSLKVG
ncbi:SpoIID/LytB domain-containing protein [Nocardioides caricicola]|uniref:SpoIID/LytB domain-containing protein n=1 Tax=Nocardioides caricicola TaxID=634770 RepID=A0ABW0MZT6_9ACTN